MVTMDDEPKVCIWSIVDGKIFVRLVPVSEFDETDPNYKEINPMEE